jgi:Asp/Glu/Hydantoin racemase
MIKNRALEGDHAARRSRCADAVVAFGLQGHKYNVIVDVGAGLELGFATDACETIGTRVARTFPESTMRIWWQSFLDPLQSDAYLERLSSYLNAISADGTTVDVYGVTPADRGFGRLTEFRCAAVAIDNALEAEEQGYDAFVFGHFQEPGLYAARSAVSMPVVGMGECSLHWSAQLGRNLALVTIDSVFERWHLEQADLYGLAGRITHVVALGTRLLSRATTEPTHCFWSASAPSCDRSWRPEPTPSCRLAPCLHSCSKASAG